MSTATSVRKDFVPIPLAEVDTAAPATTVEPNADGQVLLRVFDRGWPVWQRIESGLSSPDDVVERAVEIAGRRAGIRPDPWNPAPPATGTLISVVICTLGSDPRLPAAVASVLDQTHRDLELLVIDNDPASGNTRRVLADVGDPRMRIVAEPTRGLSAARNTGLAHVRGDIVAYTDDDARAHPRWLAEIARVFAADPDRMVGCVTGLVLAAEFESPSQVLFEEYVGFSKGFTPLRWSPQPLPESLRALAEHSDGSVAFPYSAGEFGSGNNMSFRTSLARRLGGFDEALGAGSPTYGGEDLEMFRRVYLSGSALVYMPAAVVTHHHRGDMDGLRQQMYTHGTGMAASITKAVLTGHAIPVARRMPRSLGLLLRSDSPKNERKPADFPSDVTRAELKGYLVGPFLYLKARRAVRRRRRL